MSNEKERREQIVRTKMDNPTMKGIQIANILGFPRSTVYRVLQNFRGRLSIDREKGSGKKKGFVNKKLAMKIATYYSRNPTISGRGLARKLGCSEAFIRKVRKHYKLRSFKKQKVPHRSEKQSRTAFSRARKLYDEILTQNGGCIYMDDETYVKYDFKQMPGRNYYVGKVRGKVDPRFKYIRCEKFAKKAMIWQAICTCGKASRSYITMSTMKTENYLNECLKKRLLPLIRQHDTPGLFWPDLASCHYSKLVLNWMNVEGVHFVPKHLNPPNCPELRPIERFWAIIKRILQKSGAQVSTIKSLKQRWDSEVKKSGSRLVRALMAGVNGKVRKFIRNREL